MLKRLTLMIVTYISSDVKLHPSAMHNIEIIRELLKKWFL